jgi:hypothetical protein
LEKNFRLACLPVIFFLKLCGFKHHEVAPGLPGALNSRPDPDAISDQGKKASLMVGHRRKE